MNSNTLQNYIEMIESSDKKQLDLLDLQDLIAKTVNHKGASETLYAIALGLQNSNQSEKLSGVINYILRYKI